MTDTRTKDQTIEDMAKALLAIDSSHYKEYYEQLSEEFKTFIMSKAQAAYTASGIEALKEEIERLKGALRTLVTIAEEVDDEQVIAIAKQALGE